MTVFLLLFYLNGLSVMGSDTETTKLKRKIRVMLDLKTFKIKKQKHYNFKNINNTQQKTSLVL